MPKLSQMVIDFFADMAVESGENWTQIDENHAVTLERDTDTIVVHILRTKSDGSIKLGRRLGALRLEVTK